MNHLDQATGTAIAPSVVWVVMRAVLLGNYITGIIYTAGLSWRQGTFTLSRAGGWA